VHTLSEFLQSCWGRVAGASHGSRWQVQAIFFLVLTVNQYVKVDHLGIWRDVRICGERVINSVPNQRAGSWIVYVKKIPSFCLQDASAFSYNLKHKPQKAGVVCVDLGKTADCTAQREHAVICERGKYNNASAMVAAPFIPTRASRIRMGNLFAKGILLSTIYAGEILLRRTASIFRHNTWGFPVHDHWQVTLPEHHTPRGCRNLGQ
jgi:hypothetical protein